MLEGVQEDREVHRALAHAVVVHEVLLDDAHGALDVGDLIVLAVLGLVVVLDEVAKEAAAHVLKVDVALLGRVEPPEERIKLVVEVAADDGLERVEQPLAVLVVHEAVVEHAEALVDPQALHLLRRLLAAEALGRRKHDALHHARKVAQVEDVVALGGRGEEREDGLAVDRQGSS